MTINPQEQQSTQETKQEAMPDEAFRSELRAWLAEHLIDTFREQRTMTFQEKVAVRRDWQKTLFEGGWIGIEEIARGCARNDQHMPVGLRHDVHDGERV